MKNPKNLFSLLLIIFGAVAGFTSGHLNSVLGIVLFSGSIIAIAILLYLYYRKRE